MKQLLTIIILILSAFAYAKPQSECSFTPVRVSERSAIRVLLDMTGIKADSFISVSGKLAFSNPTVFFPDSIKIENVEPDSVTSEIISSNEYDYIYSFTAKFPAKSLTGDKLGIYFAGKALAGYSREADADFKSIKINGGNIPDFSCKVVLNDSTILPIYYRLPFVEFPMPNPVPSAGSTWKFYIDSACNVQIKVYNTLGQENLYYDLGFLQAGPHEFRMEPNADMSSGCYRLKMICNLGVVIKSFVVIK